MGGPSVCRSVSVDLYTHPRSTPPLLHSLNPIKEPTAIACTHTFCRYVHVWVAPLLASRRPPCSRHQPLLYICRECIDDHLSDNSYCPKCQQPSYRKDMRPNNGMVRDMIDWPTATHMHYPPTPF